MVEESVKCKLCNRYFKSIKSIVRHISQTHKNISSSSDIPTKIYYDKFIKTSDEGVCVVCGNHTKWDGFVLGYNKTCCRSHSAILYRKRLKDDNTKYKQFVDKVSNNQKDIWAYRDNSDIRERISSTRKETISKMSEHERIERFGWLNKKTGEERKEIIKKITQPMIFWYKKFNTRRKGNFL
jgi:hypothetical protein